ncbi:MAG: PEGA domain-containing protein [Candidatus Eisenbacteria bacterium]|uniref:PEGA domain-containing protein n=1 Tax=Eiseniibacteriota bacterium TaxID=2212470 RepID=A0A9D6QLI9_UNCEI|nr:PEGA domain-containing protein [Candidatus Eisenbacteria bacterium]MBI3538748.1 PEGA domain-containing protein [Candidatus Eisenbacteria bacterium]
MTVRTALVASLMAVAIAAPAWAQVPARSMPGTTGSLTIMSRPSGASFRLIGDQSVVGRTPMTLDRGLAGRYRVWGEDIGYERWKRAIALDGVTADTVWMTLKTKSGLMAGLRSFIIPGWGQFYDDHPGRGTVFMLAGLATGAGAVYAQSVYRNRVDDFQAADAAYQAATTPAEIASTFAARTAASRRAQDAYDARRWVAIGGAALWGLSWLEAAISVPHPVGPILLGGATGFVPAPSATGDGVTVTVAQMRF